MTKKKRQLRTSVFIACEGRNTEPIYFERLVEEIEEQGVFAVTIYPDKTETDPVSHALGLVEEARSRIDEFDEVWAVFDRNGYTKHRETFELANLPVNGKVVHIAFSSISFEQWILLHFLKTTEPFEKSAQIVERLRTMGYFPVYAKTTYIDTYSFLKDKTLRAIENAAWLRDQVNDNPSNVGLPIFELNPYTDVDKLVIRLLDIRENYFWGRPGHWQKAGNVKLKVEVASAESVQISAINLTAFLIVYNAANAGEHFRFRDDTGSCSFSIDRTALLLPNDETRFELTCTRACAGLTLEFRNDADLLLMAL